MLHRGKTLVPVQELSHRFPELDVAVEPGGVELDGPLEGREGLKAGAGLFKGEAEVVIVLGTRPVELDSLLERFPGRDEVLRLEPALPELRVEISWALTEGDEAFKVAGGAIEVSLALSNHGEEPQSIPILGTIVEDSLGGGGGFGQPP